MSMSGISQQEAEKAFKVPILGGVLKAAISFIGFCHILKGAPTGLAITINNLTKDLNKPKPTTK